MKKFCLLPALICCSLTMLQAQVERPKLVVGIVVDQMRWDYLYRYQARYGEGGFKRLLGEGFTCENTMIPYVPTVTAIGHSCIYTGSVPSITGIAGNNFMLNGQETYCTDDASVRGVGTTSEAGRMSPRNLQTTTIGDELRLATNGRSKVVGVALKDRASILPAGKNPTGSYWFDNATGGFVTSTWYCEELPEWVKAFNNRHLPDLYLSKPWETLYPEETYTESTTDWAPEYEKEVSEGFPARLPLDLPAIYEQMGYDIVRRTPFGNTLTLQMAKAAIEGEQLGGDDWTDLLCVSCSSTDYIGHQVGTNAVEIEDVYLRLDKDIEDFLIYLDEHVGKGNYLVFLTADHGAMNNKTFLNDRRMAAASWNEEEVKDCLNRALGQVYTDAGELVACCMNYQVFFDIKKIDSLCLSYDEVKAACVRILQNDPRVLYACDQERTATASIPEPIRTRIINGYNRERSGGVQVITKPRNYYGDDQGTDHGMWNPYDSHIPLVFMGWGIKHGATTLPTYMTDIAPTLCALLHIQMPDGCVGTPISRLIE